MRTGILYLRPFFTWFAGLTSIALIASLVTLPPSQTVHADRGVVDLWKAILPLTTVASAMNTGAHPDDEHSATLAYLSLGKGIETTSLIANRGEGGQNEIGGELGNSLGIIRTRELQEASKITNVNLINLSEQMNDQIYDFGFSKSPDETLEKWGEQNTYERLIRHIRQVRPDIVIPAFLNEESTHGHHRAMNVITVRAFEDAANPAVFPEQVKAGLSPWQVKKLYLPASVKDYTVRVPIGDYDQIYGASYKQLGEESRFMHKSQGMGRHYEEGPDFVYYKLAKSVGPIKQKEGDLFEGVSTTFEDWSKEIAQQKQGGRLSQKIHQLQSDAEHILRSYPDFLKVAKGIHQMKKDVTDTIKEAKSTDLDARSMGDVLHRLQIKERQLNKASAEALSFVGKVKTASNELIPGQTTKVTVTAYNGSQVAIKNVRISLKTPEGWKVNATGPTTFGQVGYNQTISVTYDVRIPKHAVKFHPYRLPIFSSDITYSAFGEEATLHAVPQATVGILPPFSLSLSPDATVLNTLQQNQSIPVNVTVKNNTTGACEPTISLVLPAGWIAKPASSKLSFANKGETKSILFQVTPSQKVKNGTYEITAKASAKGLQSQENVQVITYPHIGTTYYIHPATLAIQAFDLQLTKNIKVGYISSGFDQIDQYLRQLGINVVNLDAKAVESGDLDQYDTIVLGIRAYGFRPELIPSNKRLLQYVENGGNLVVLYHKPEDKWTPDLAPYPITIGQPLIKWRVTDENSKVTMLQPEHPLFTTPNRITAQDWNHWVQDRSAYNPSAWGKEYIELISNGDAKEKEFTGTYLTAKYGKGTYTYSSLVWYRQIPSLVPGAIRMFVNMISLKQ
ncbi:NEW3 domain-containing protein [Brevibacillus laterosporus]